MLLENGAKHMIYLLIRETINKMCGISSFGRTSACHAEGDGFKPRISLQADEVDWQSTRSEPLYHNSPVVRPMVNKAVSPPP